FVDPRLQRLIEIALNNNRDLRVAVLNIAAARAQYQITRADLFPKLDAVGTGDRQRLPNALTAVPGRNITTTYNVGLQASWELDLFGRIQSLRDQALAKYLATAQARKASEIALVAQVADQYLTVLSTDDLLKVTENTLKTAQASYDLTKLRFDNGTGSELDLRQAQTIVETALANQQAQARARAQAVNALVLLVGQPLPDDLPPGLPLDAQNFLTDIPAGLPSDLLAQARKASEILLVSQVADQYLTVLAYDDLLKVTDDTLKTAQASYDLTKLKFDNGTGSELDLRQAQTIVETAQANQQSQARLRAQALNALVLLVGQPLPDDLPPGLPLDAQNFLTDIPAGLSSDLLTRRPDIMEAEQNLLAANANIGAARAAFFPRISLTGAFGTASPTLGGLFKAGTAAWSFAPQITMPIFEGGANLANLDLANVQKRIEIANYEKAIQSAFREVSDGLAARGTYDQQIAALQRNEHAQQRRYDLSDLRYKNGVDSYLSVLTAQTDLYAAQQTLINARLAR
ncbi:efflux transporter outer membrane subunit, partial [Burkholderia ubonensis]|uniref:efflux transporter outer membrane subunit n=1 Tax=Burkholderia ubonensis TaxID=101571 RepID=UPI000A7117A2